MAAKSTGIQHRAPFVSLWSRDDVRTAVVDFLPTKAVAALPLVAKPLSAAQTPLLVTAIRRRGKTTVPSPQTTRKLLDSLLVGEPQYFCEKWERGLEQWSEESPDEYTVNVCGSSMVRLDRYLVLHWGSHSLGLRHPFRGENLLVTRLRITMSYLDCESRGAVGYAMLHGPDSASGRFHDFIAGPRFDSDTTGSGVISLIWRTPNHVLVDGATPGTLYTVDARISSESVTSSMGRADVSVDGQLVFQGLRVPNRPLSALGLHNYSVGISQFRDLEVWYEKAPPNQVWFHYDDSESEESESEESQSEA